MNFEAVFKALTGYPPMRWQRQLFDQLVRGDIPSAVDLPTGLGKTSVMTLWLMARASTDGEARKALPRRLVYVVDRRAVVDQATDEAEKLRDALECNISKGSKAEHLRKLEGEERQRTFAILRELKGRLALERSLPISTLRGQHADNREWLADPASPAIVVGTVDMIGSRLLFSGYGVSRKMRPYHAGLLGADTLVLLDEAHLVPPFQHLLRSMERDEALRGAHPEARRVPAFVLLPLSATQLETPEKDRSGRNAFELDEKDISHDDVAEQRVNARKKLALHEAVEKWDEALAAKAWALATGERNARVVIFCNRRDRQDDSSKGPSVGGVLDELKKLEKKHKTEIACELLVGGRRVKERQDAADNLKSLGFTLPGDTRAAPDKPTFLLATSAGEVGVDFDADHMVSDLAPWERMVQRLGRVNRRGGKAREAIIAVFDSSETEKDEDRKERLTKTLGLLERIAGGDAQLGSAALAKLREQVGYDEVVAASSPEPLRPALTRALADAWSMTSLEHHTGRPDIAPWLRGWIKDDLPQTTVIWRTHLPVLVDEEGRQSVTAKNCDGFFEAAPPHLTEELETESYRVAPWLIERAKAAKKAELVKDDDVVALALEPDASFRRAYRLGTLLDEDKKFKERLERELANATLVVAARLAGLLTTGLLNEDSSAVPRTADDGETWSEEEGKPVTGFRVRRVSGDQAPSDPDWKVSFRLVLKEGEDGEPAEALVVEGLNEERRSETRNPQLLVKHQSWTAIKARVVANALALSDELSDVLALAARLHDEGKRAANWQRAFGAARDGIYAKTKGPFRHEYLCGYRHEFGSLPYAENDEEFAQLKQSNPALADLVLHLIAAHHGNARPVISTEGCEDAPPSALEGRARDVALRFARLQKQWGPWGLAWWEALMRAADQQASRAIDNPEEAAAMRAAEAAEKR